MNKKYNIDDLFIANVGILLKSLYAADTCNIIKSPGKGYICDNRDLDKCYYIIQRSGNSIDGSFGYSIVNDIKIKYFKYNNNRVARNLGAVLIQQEIPLKDWINKTGEITFEEIKEIESKLNELEMKKRLSDDYDEVKVSLEYQALEELCDNLKVNEASNDLLDAVERLKSYYHTSATEIRKKCQNSILKKRELENLLWGYCSKYLDELFNQEELLNQVKLQRTKEL